MVTHAHERPLNTLLSHPKLGAAVLGRPYVFEPNKHALSHLAPKIPEQTLLELYVC